MIRVARFAVDPRSHRARAELLQHLFVPRSRRETILLRLGRALPPRLLAAPADTAPAAAHEACIAAASELLGEILVGGLDLLPAPQVEAPLRVLFAWRGDAIRPFAVVKAGGAEAAGRLDAESTALDELSSEGHGESVPRRLARGERQGLQLLVQSHLPGRSLARWLALRGTGAWPASAFREHGALLGRIHAGGRRHGDAWGRNLLVDRAGRPTGWVDWEASARGGQCAAEALRFLIATARADLSARAGRWRRLAGDDDTLCRWLLTWGPAAAAARAFLAGWAAQAGGPARSLGTALVPERLGLRAALSERTQALLEGALGEGAQG